MWLIKLRFFKVGLKDMLANFCLEMSIDELNIEILSKKINVKWTINGGNYFNLISILSQQCNRELNRGGKEKKYVICTKRGHDFFYILLHVYNTDKIIPTWFKISPPQSRQKRMGRKNTYLLPDRAFQNFYFPTSLSLLYYTQLFNWQIYFEENLPIAWPGCIHLCKQN